MVWKAIFTGIAVAALALAQGRGQQDGGGERGGGGGGGGGMRAQKESKFDQVANRLKLNKDQKAEAATILTSTAKDAVPLAQQLLQGRNMLASAMLGGKSQAEMDPITKAMSEVQFQMTGVEVRAFQKILALLKPNQTAKAPEAFDLMAGIFVMPQVDVGGQGGGMGRRGDR